jgi:hypothetical protein
MNLEDQMNVARDADRMSKKDIKNAKKRARRAAKKAAAKMNVGMAATPSVPDNSTPDPMAYSTEAVIVAACAAQGTGLVVEIPVAAPAPSADQKVDAVIAPVITETAKPGKSGRKNTFTRGSSTFKCESCGRLTRFTGAQSMDTKLCPECYTIADEVNHPSDNGTLADNPTFILSMFADIRAKGGTVPADFAQAEELARAAAPPVAVEAPKPAKITVKKAVLDCFYAVPGKVFSTQDAVSAIQATHAGMNESSIRVWITDFQKDGSIKKAGNDGRKMLLTSGDLGKFAKGYIAG